MRCLDWKLIHYLEGLDVVLCDYITSNCSLVFSLKREEREKKRKEGEREKERWWWWWWCWGGGGGAGATPGA